MPESLIVLKNLSKRFGKKKAVNRISMSIPVGEIFGFLGANGAGKNDDDPHAVRVDQTDRRQRNDRQFKYLEGSIQDSVAVWLRAAEVQPLFDLTVGENLRFFAGAYRVAASRIRDRTHKVLCDMDLESRQAERAGSLSGGYKQLLAIACALIHEPTLLFLDEPTAGLDPTHRQAIWDLIYELSQSGTTIFVTTHYMDEAERCTDVGFVDGGRLIANGTPRDLKESLKEHLLEVQVEPAMAAMFEFRKLPGVYGADLRSGNVRLQVEDPDALLHSWQVHWPFPNMRFLGFNWVEPDMEDVFLAYSRGYYRPDVNQEEPAKHGVQSMISLNAILAIAYKEFVHVWRDRRVMLLIVVLPPFFTFLFGHAFENSTIRDVPAMYFDADHSQQSQEFLALLKAKDIFDWKPWHGDPEAKVDLFPAGVDAAIVIPVGWGKALRDGEPKPIRAVLDGSDTNTAPSVQGVLQETLGDYQSKQRDDLIENLPDEVIDLGKQLPIEIRHEFSSMMTPWDVKTETLYNPNLSFIDYVMPGIVGLILQLITVTLIASTITRERESGTLSQLMVTPLRQTEIVIGKVLPYLVISMFLIASTILVGNLHFGVKFQQPLLLSITCFLFLLFSLGLGLLISAFSRTQTQAIQISIFFLLPVMLLSGAFAPLGQLPRPVRICSELFPLTHFCRAFRNVNLHHSHISSIAGDLAFLALGAIVTCAGASYLLRSVDE